MPHEITIIKNDHNGNEVTRYPGLLKEDMDDEIIVEISGSATTTEEPEEITVIIYDQDSRLNDSDKTQNP